MSTIDKTAWEELFGIRKPTPAARPADFSAMFDRLFNLYRPEKRASLPVNTYHVYILFDPTMPDLVFYVGLTTNPRNRYSGHKNEKGYGERRAWKNMLRQLGRQPAMKILTTFEDCLPTARETEFQFMAQLAAQGHPITNITSHPGRRQSSQRWDNRAWRRYYPADALQGAPGGDVGA